MHIPANKDNVIKLGSLSAHGLPPRQAMILLLTARAHTAKEAAKHMGCSPETVKTQLQELHRKFGTRRSIGLITAAFEHNVLRFLCLLISICSGIQVATTEATRFQNRPATRLIARAKTHTRELWWEDGQLLLLEATPC